MDNNDNKDNNDNTKMSYIKVVTFEDVASDIESRRKLFHQGVTLTMTEEQLDSLFYKSLCFISDIDNTLFTRDDMKEVQFIDKIINNDDLDLRHNIWGKIIDYNYKCVKGYTDPDNESRNKYLEDESLTLKLCDKFAVEFLNSLQDKGAQVYFVTGRPIDCMKRTLTELTL